MGNLSKDAAKAVDAVRDVIDQAIAETEEKVSHIEALEKQRDNYEHAIGKMQDIIDNLTAENAELKMKLLKAEQKISEQEYNTLHSMYYSKKYIEEKKAILEKREAAEALKARKAKIKGDIDYLLMLDRITCEEWNSLLSMKNASEEDVLIAEEIIKGYMQKLVVELPKAGSKINWWGTEYTVDSVVGNNVKVTLNNGLEVTLYWWNTKGCQILRRENVAV